MAPPLLYVSLLIMLQLIQPALCRPQAREREPVKIDMFVMSKCPDAAKCDAVMNQTLSLLRYSADNDTFTLRTHYIERDGGCLHGSSECEGNMYQLCAQKLYPDNFRWWDFIVCQASNYPMVPTNAESCATHTGLSYSALKACVDVDGPTLQRQSFDYTQTVNPHMRSCTIYVNGAEVCKVDSGYYLPPACQHPTSLLFDLVCRDNPQLCLAYTRDRR